MHVNDCHREGKHTAAAVEGMDVAGDLAGVHDGIHARKTNAFMAGKTPEGARDA